MKDTELRRILEEKYGKGNVKIGRRYGAVVVYGTMPNTNIIGWYFMEWRKDVENKLWAENEAQKYFTNEGKGE